jgi:23S rRNA (guanosine2251-2'-O)-methyltransferase
MIILLKWHLQVCISLSLEITWEIKLSSGSSCSNPIYLRMLKWRMDELSRKSVDEFRKAEKLPVQIVLDNVRSMHNVGSVFRTADGFLLEGICLCGYTPRPPHRDIHKTALGATETVSWAYYSTTVEAIQRLREEGYNIVAVEQSRNSHWLQETEWDGKEKVALVFGNEVEGVSEEVLSVCDACIEIPQWGMKHSLNISVAAGVVCWEFVRKCFGYSL